MIPAHSHRRLALPQVTLCAVTSVNVLATIRALHHSMTQVNFASCKLFTHADIPLAHDGIEVIKIDCLGTAEAYSKFILKHLADHIDTSHCLIAQWDGHVVDASKWQPAFLDFDYIGARWPQFDDGHDVGNGGFSLRSRRLMEACQSLEFQCSHPEDLAIARVNRRCLEQLGMRFANGAMADDFSVERKESPLSSFGYHGVWNMPQVIGHDAFWNIYLGLDDRKTIRTDLFKLAAITARSPRGLKRVLRLLVDQLFDAILRGLKFG